MSKFKPFVAGAAIGNLLFMNHVYENELLKQEMRDEITTLKRIRDFDPSQILECRDVDMEKRLQRIEQSKGVTSIERLDTHYSYLYYQGINALKESILRTSEKPTILFDNLKGESDGSK